MYYNLSVQCIVYTGFTDETRPHHYINVSSLLLVAARHLQNLNQLLVDDVGCLPRQVVRATLDNGVGAEDAVLFKQLLGTLCVNIGDVDHVGGALSISAAEIVHHPGTTYMHDIDLDIKLRHARYNIISFEQLVDHLREKSLLLWRSAVLGLPCRNLLLALGLLGGGGFFRIGIDTETGLDNHGKVLFDVGEAGGKAGNRRLTLCSLDKDGRAGVDDAVDDVGALECKTCGDETTLRGTDEGRVGDFELVLLFR